MGIKPTRSNFKAFSFDGTSSRNYGVYITGQGVFNAPERNVEMVDIPGRDGAYALDRGNFNNIEVTYPASIVADTEADFADAVSDLRNFLCSKVGYCRLEDEYNPNEYRMAIYKSGLEVSHEGLQTGEFDITFECKPQRWLTSGETKQTLTSGNAITNPTLFPARPQLQVYGYGDITIGSDEVISVTQADIGGVIIQNEEKKESNNSSVYFYPEFGKLATGDTFDVSCHVAINIISNKLSAGSITSSTNCESTSEWYDPQNRAIFSITTPSYTFTKGTTASATSSSIATSITINGTTYTPTYSVSVGYTQWANRISISISRSGTLGGSPTVVYKSTLYPITAYSTLQTTGNPLYIDLDIGEAWNSDSGTPVSVNNAVSIPAELPTLPSGATTITFDNTFTKVDIVPRWWRV